MLNNKFVINNSSTLQKFYTSLTDAQIFHGSTGLGSGSTLYAHPVTFEISSEDKKTLISVKLDETDENRGPVLIVHGESSTYEWVKTPDDLKVNLGLSDKGDGTVPSTSQTILDENNKISKSSIFLDWNTVLAMHLHKCIQKQPI